MSYTVVLAFARMNPPTVGHGLLCKKVVETATLAGADHVIYLTQTVDKKKNPLSLARKLFWAKKMFHGVNIVGTDARTKTFIDAVKSLDGKYGKLVVVAGSDRVAEFKTLLEKYNGKDYKFASIEVVSAGERDPDADNATGMSASKMRKAAAEDNIREFKKGLPSSFKDSESTSMMKEVRVGMGILSEGVSYESFMTNLSKTLEH